VVFDGEIMVEFSRSIGYVAAIFASIIGIRFLLYYHSFFLRWPRYRQLRVITTKDMKVLSNIPFAKIQITTRGLPDSTRVIRRGIQNIIEFVKEAPELYGDKLSIEVVTESDEQKDLLEQYFAESSFPVQALAILVPEEYRPPNGTKLKARALHYMIELRRRGFNHKPGRSFIVHYDEESVMEPDELRKLIHYLANTSKQLSEGPIFYPLEYTDASMICRAMEANRPIACFECRKVMENGTPLHLHGSNLVVDEDLECTLGWDIGTLYEQPLVAEDYVFGVRAYLRFGPQIFGWHGSIMLEQPPFTLKSAFKQRYRWILGVLQGVTLMQQMPEFQRLSGKERLYMVWGTRYRLLTFALGLPTGAFSLFYLLYQLGIVLSGHNYLPLPWPIMCWLIFVSFLWLNSMFIGAWYNLSNARHLSLRQRVIEGMRVLSVAPIAGLVESGAGFWAVIQWLVGNRKASWQPTAKTVQARKTLHTDGWLKQRSNLYEGAQFLKYAVGMSVVILLYMIIPLMIVLSLVFSDNWSRLLVAFEIVALGELAISRILLKTTRQQKSRLLPSKGQEVIGRQVFPGFRAIRQISMNYGAAVLMLGMCFQWLLLGWGSPWTSNAAFQKTSASSQSCVPQSAITDIIGPGSGKRPVDFQTGVIFPQWGSTGYSAVDKNWQVGLHEIQQQTAAQWVGVSINLYQDSLTSTRVRISQATPTTQAVIEGIRTARAMGYHVFVFPQLTVGGARSWSGDIQFPTYQLAQTWFDNYWMAFKPYVVAAAQAGAEELAIGSEYELLQPAAPALWNQLIERVHQVFPGKLTYDINWSSLYYPLPSWLHNHYLNAIGVSVYTPLTDTPRRLDPNTLPARWQTTIGKLLDTFSVQIGKPVLVSEIGYRNSSDALYNPWEVFTNAQPDQVEQAAAYNAALSNLMGDPHIVGVFAWAWEFQPFDLRCRLAAQVLHHWYAAQPSSTVMSEDVQVDTYH
jgi:Glycosyl transferase family group 2